MRPVALCGRRRRQVMLTGVAVAVANCRLSDTYIGTVVAIRMGMRICE